MQECLLFWKSNVTHVKQVIIQQVCSLEISVVGSFAALVKVEGVQASTQTAHPCSHAASLWPDGSEMM